MATPHIENDEHYSKKHKVTVVGSGNWYVPFRIYPVPTNISTTSFYYK